MPKQVDPLTAIKKQIKALEKQVASLSKSVTSLKTKATTKKIARKRVSKNTNVML